jgi:hypothetical protein
MLQCNRNGLDLDRDGCNHTQAPASGICADAGAVDRIGPLREPCRGGRVDMRRFAGIAALGLALAACKPAAPTPDPAAAPMAGEFYDEVRNGGDIEADPHVAHELKNPTSEDQIAEFKALIPADSPSAIDTQSEDSQTTSEGTLTRLSQIYRYSDRTLLVQTALFKAPSGTEPVIVGFKVSPYDSDSGPAANASG